MEDTQTQEAQEKAKCEYSLHFILNPSQTQEGILAYKESINEKIQNAGGNIQSSLCHQAPQRLAYPIKKELSGYMCESVFAVDSEMVPQISEGLSRDKSIIRFMIQTKKKATGAAKERRIRKRPTTKTFSPNQDESSSLQQETEDAKEKREKVSIEEIDKKLDEIIKNI